MSEPILDRFRRTLLEADVAFKEIQHPVTLTSEESAQARGEALGVGAKALLLLTDDAFRLFVLPADRRLDSAAVKREFGIKRFRFATAEELLTQTGLVPGSVPPFGQPILPFPLFADISLGSKHDRVAFNAGSLTDSIIMSATDWEKIAQPKRFEFAKE